MRAEEAGSGKGEARLLAPASEAGGGARGTKGRGRVRALRASP